MLKTGRICFYLQHKKKAKREKIGDLGGKKTLIKKKRRLAHHHSINLLVDFSLIYKILKAS